MTPLEFGIRFGLTFILALIFGLERQRAFKPSGFGTYVFVSAGACGLALVSQVIHTDNPLPLLSAIVTSIGFLGAGSMMKSGDKVSGFTTAASIWIFAIFGLLMGIGQFSLGGILYGIIWGVVFIDRYLQVNGLGSYQRKLILKTSHHVAESEIKKIFAQFLTGAKVMSVSIDKENKSITRSYLVEGNKDQINKLPDALYGENWVSSCTIE